MILGNKVCDFDLLDSTPNSIHTTLSGNDAPAYHAWFKLFTKNMGQIVIFENSNAHWELEYI